MPSVALQEWQGTRSVQLDELDAAHGAVGGTGPGRRYATRQLNHAYTVVLAAQFQGFCLAATLDEVLAQHLEPMIGGRPW